MEGGQGEGGAAEGRTTPHTSAQDSANKSHFKNSEVSQFCNEHFECDKIYVESLDLTFSPAFEK